MKQRRQHVHTQGQATAINRSLGQVINHGTTRVNMSDNCNH